MQIVLGVEALAPDLTGIGRYTWELSRGLEASPCVESVRYYRGGQWITDPARLLLPDMMNQERRRNRLVRWWERRRSRARLKTGLFHGPNFFLPPNVEDGVITVHDLSVLHYPDTHPAERISYFERNFERSIRSAAHVITDSETVRAELIAFAGLAADRVTAVHLGVAKAFRPHTPVEILAQLAVWNLAPQGYTLCVSTLEPRKKIIQLLQAWGHMAPAARQRQPLVLAGGSGWLNDSLRALITQGEREGWVRYLGYVPEAMLPALYAGARLFVYPSTYEGFGLPPIEAMASGVPVVVADASCLPEITKGAAMLVEPDDVSAFAVALEHALTDDSWRQQAITSGLDVACGYDWAHCVADTIAVYRKVVGGGK